MRRHRVCREREECGVVCGDERDALHRVHRAAVGEVCGGGEQQPVAGEESDLHPRGGHLHGGTGEEAPVCVARVGRGDAEVGDFRPAVLHEEEHGGGGEHDVREEGEAADLVDARRVVAEQDGERGESLRAAAVREPRDTAGDCEQQRAAEHGVLDHTQRRDEMRGVARVVDRRDAAGHEDARVVPQRFAPRLQPSAEARKQAARRDDEAELHPRREARDDMLIGEVPEEDEAREQHDDADADEPHAPEFKFERRTVSASDCGHGHARGFADEFVPGVPRRRRSGIVRRGMHRTPFDPDRPRRRNRRCL